MHAKFKQIPRKPLLRHRRQEIQTYVSTWWRNSSVNHRDCSDRDEAFSALTTTSNSLFWPTCSETKAKNKTNAKNIWNTRNAYHKKTRTKVLITGLKSEPKWPGTTFPWVRTASVKCSDFKFTRFINDNYRPFLAASGSGRGFSSTHSRQITRKERLSG